MAVDRTGEWSWRVFFRGVAEAMGLRTGPRPDVPIETLDPWNAAGGPSPPNGVTALLDEIERDALAVYAEHGLPTRPGHYARAPGDRDWRFVAERMGPEDRWALVMDYPPEQGWKFAGLADLGLHGPGPETAQAAGRLLNGCATLRGALRSGSPNGVPEALEAALRLGAAWRGLQAEAAREAVTVELAKPKRIARKKTT